MASGWNNRFASEAPWSDFHVDFWKLASIHPKSRFDVVFDLAASRSSTFYITYSHFPQQENSEPCKARNVDWWGLPRARSKNIKIGEFWTRTTQVPTAMVVGNTGSLAQIFENGIRNLEFSQPKEIVTEVRWQSGWKKLPGSQTELAPWNPQTETWKHPGTSAFYFMLFV